MALIEPAAPKKCANAQTHFTSLHNHKNQFQLRNNDIQWEIFGKIQQCLAFAVSCHKRLGYQYFDTCHTNQCSFQFENLEYNFGRIKAFDIGSRKNAVWLFDWLKCAINRQ